MAVGTLIGSMLTADASFVMVSEAAVFEEGIVVTPGTTSGLIGGAGLSLLGAVGWLAKGVGLGGMQADHISASLASRACFLSRAASCATHSAVRSVLLLASRVDRTRSTEEDTICCCCHCCQRLVLGMRRWGS